MTKEDCEFGVIYKKDFEHALAKIEQKNRDLMIDFLKNVPYFTHWTRTSISKMLYYIEKQLCIRNQEVFREGDQVNYVYIVRNGEFEVTKRTVVLEDKFKTEEKRIKPILNYGRKFKDDSLFKKKKDVCQTKVRVLGPGKTFGEEFVMTSSEAGYTVRCLSLHGELCRVSA